MPGIMPIINCPIIVNYGGDVAYRNQLIANDYVGRMRQERVSDERLIEFMTDHSPFRVNLGDTFLDSDNPDHRDFLDRYAAMYVYREKYGEDATLPYLGLRKPKGFRENLVMAITGKFPRIKD